MLEHVEEKDVVVLANVEIERIVEIALDHLDSGRGLEGGMEVDDGDLAALLGDQARHSAGSSAKVEDLGPTRDGLERIRMAGRISEFQVVLRRLVLLNGIQRALVEQPRAVRDAPQGG